ncbi:MAG: Rieske 2Fe-2S domain-containing protein, partial [Actinobacteria bacterium]|nr:Rieske 2Fe-2S domain-containing protein [Actinomycetota bacterium]
MRASLSPEPGRGDLAAYYNVCRHRGSVLSAEPGKPSQAEIGPTGTFRGSIQCPYHNWPYSFTGELRAARFLDEDFDKATLPLHPSLCRCGTAGSGSTWSRPQP